MLGRMAAQYLRSRGCVVLGGADYFYNEDGLATPRNHDFVADPRFIKALASSRSAPLAQKGLHHGRWNMHVSLWAASHALKLDADIVQLGVCEGSEAAAIVDFANFEKQQRRLFLVDTFTGVPEEQWTQAERDAGADSAQWLYKGAGDLSAFVRQRFSKCPNVVIVQGRVPDVLPSVTAERIGLLMLDLNVASPERAGCEILWDRIVSGGIILSDDYGHSRENSGYYAQKISFDEFAKIKGVEVLSLPTGHAIIIKP
jgi:O-methyltransferase